MQLIVEGAFVEDDWQWQEASADFAVPETTARILGSLTFELPQFAVRHWFWQPGIGEQSRYGISVPPDFDAALLNELTVPPQLLAVIFETHGDGRGFSLARAVREQGFTGELRAFGALIPDQYEALVQSGFDAVMLAHDAADRHTERAWQTAFAWPTQVYVPAAARLRRASSPTAATLTFGDARTTPSG